MPPWGALGLQRIFGHRMPPMALLVLAGLARRHGWSVQVVDLNEGSLPEELPDAVGITVWTMFAPRAYIIADHYRDRGVPVMLGGVHPSMMPSEALRHADAVVVGEAESVLGTVLADLLEGRSRGLYRGSWLAMTETAPAEEWLDLVQAWPKYRYLPANTLQTTRGCRFNCDFCSVIRINGRGSRHGDARAVVEQLASVLRGGQRLGPFRYTFFLDDDLAADPAYTAELCEAILSAGVKTYWGAQASIGLAGDPKLVTLAARAGCRVIFTGFESTSRETLVECNKKNRPSQFGEAVRRLHQNGILVEGAFIFGFDHDTPDVFHATAEFADDIEIDAAHFSLLTPYPGTATFARFAREGRVLHHNWGLYDLYHAAIKPVQLDPQQLEDGLWTAYRSFYARRQRRHRMRRHAFRPFHPAFSMAFTRSNWNYSRLYRGPGACHDLPFEAEPEDVADLLVTSAASAPQAMSVAISQYERRTR